ncbi:MAG: hypothetical protein P8Y48_17685, partial [Novosphingobium sp.]
DPDAAGFDWPGACAFTATRTLFTLSTIQGPALDWTKLIWLGQVEPGSDVSALLSTLVMAQLAILLPDTSKNHRRGARLNRFAAVLRQRRQERRGSRVSSTLS